MSHTRRLSATTTNIESGVSEIRAYAALDESLHYQRWQAEERNALLAVNNALEKAYIPISKIRSVEMLVKACKAAENEIKAAYQYVK